LKNARGERKITSEMDSIDTDMDAHQIQDEPIENIEEVLEHLDDLDNETRLEVLYQEINHFIMHGIQPNENWYQERMYYVQEYQTIQWGDLAARSYQKDNVIYELSLSIIDHIDQLEEEWSTSPVFNLCVYQRLLGLIRTVWRRYAQEYGTSPHTVDILDLMNGMDNM
jgi:hypothetical protein